MLILFSLGCGTETPQAVQSRPVEPLEKHVEKPKPKPTRERAQKKVDPCKLLDAAVVSEALGLEVPDFRANAEGGAGGRKLCSFEYEGGGTVVEVLDKPAKTVRLLIDRSAVAEPDLGVVAAYREASNTMTWAVTEKMVVQLRVDQGPGVQVPHERLRKLADVIDERAR